MADLPEIKSQKSTLRAQSQRRRVALADKDDASRRICASVAASAEFRAARVVLLYADHGSEVRTGALIEAALAQGKTVVVPYCVGQELRLFRLENMDELAPGAYDIREPRPALREQSARRIAPQQLDLVVVPGVAFDRSGARLGHGKGFYDRLLAQVRPSTFLVAPAFECQVFESIPTLPHDLPVHRVVTEANVYPKSGKEPQINTDGHR